MDVTYYGRVIQRDPCSYCGGRGGTKDHIVPRSQDRKGNHVADNLTGACLQCNFDKSDLDLLGFLWIRSQRREAEAALLTP